MATKRRGRQRAAVVEGRRIVPVSMPRPLAERLAEAAYAERRTLSAFIRYAAEKEADRVLSQPQSAA